MTPQSSMRSSRASLADPALGKYENAVRAFDKILKLTPDNAAVLYQKGRALAKLLRFDEVSGALEASLRTARITSLTSGYEGNGAVTNSGGSKRLSGISTGQLRFHRTTEQRGTGKGRSYLDLARYSDAISCFDQVLSGDGRCAGALLNKGSALLSLGEFGPALDSLVKALDLKPQNANGWYDRAIALTELGRYDEAVASYDRAIAINRKYTHAGDQKGVVLARPGSTGSHPGI